MCMKNNIMLSSYNQTHSDMEGENMLTLCIFPYIIIIIIID